MEGKRGSQGGRVQEQAGEEIERSKPISFYFEGRKITGYQGDTVASALYASGLRTFTRSFKYHRSRGLFCVSGKCANCMMNVDGRPNVRACVEPVNEGTKVRHQNAWPSLDHDAYSSIERLSRFMPVGFYYKTFINFPWEWKRVHGPIRKVAGLGSLDDELAAWKESSNSGGPHSHAEAKPAFDQEYMHADVAVVGGGPAGMVAAREASRLGAKVVLIDDQVSLGGHLRYSDDAVALDATAGESAPSGWKAYELAQDLARSVSQIDRITIINNATTFGLYESNLLGIVQGTRKIRLRAKAQPSKVISISVTRPT